jgi:hypothetical protein
MHIKFPLIVATLLLLAIKSSAQPPSLGTAATYVLFSSTGAVGNTGARSHFTGDVGTVTGAITMNVNVNGVIHNGDPATLAAAADVFSAYQQLNATIATSFDSVTIGNGDTVTAGVDSLAGTTLLDSTLILDGGGNTNALFIFKVYGTLNTSENARIILINGARACNVFWMVDGAINLAPGTVMRGTMIANSNAIDLGSGVTLDGRALTSTAGAITATNVLTSVPVDCGGAALTGPIAPALLSTECYALFTGNGENTNSGTTNVTGDIGSNVGLTTGYDPLNVIGVIHTNPDTSTAHCSSDLLLVYNYLNNLPADIELMYPAQFGNSLVLTPHVYLLNSATELTDTLLLNAMGNADAVFVIKINGALSTSVNSVILLTNGAQAKNIYWKIDGATSINDFSIFKGTIVGNNGAINLSTGVNLEGRALTTDGAFTTQSITAAIPSGVCNVVPLPVTWLYFTGKPVGKNILLEWATTQELNNRVFTIEKSKNAVDFEVLTSINAGSKDNYYSFTDTAPYGGGFYRISQTDRNGQRHYFQTVYVQVTGSSNITHYVQDMIFIKTSGLNPGSATIGMYNMDGKKVSSQSVNLTSEVKTYGVEKPTVSGLYLLYLECQGQRLYTAKVMID